MLFETVIFEEILSYEEQMCRTSFKSLSLKEETKRFVQRRIGVVDIVFIPVFHRRFSNTKRFVKQGVLLLLSIHTFLAMSY